MKGINLAILLHFIIYIPSSSNCQIDYILIENKFPQLKDICKVTLYQNFPRQSKFENVELFLSEYKFNSNGRVISQVFFKYPEMHFGKIEKPKRYLTKDSIIYNSNKKIEKILTFKSKPKIEFSQDLHIRNRQNKKIEKVKWKKLVSEKSYEYDINNNLTKVTVKNNSHHNEEESLSYRNEYDENGTLLKRYQIYFNEYILTDSFVYSNDTIFQYSAGGHRLNNVDYFDKELNRKVRIKLLGGTKGETYFINYYDKLGITYSESTDGIYQLYYTYNEKGLLEKEEVYSRGQKELQYFYKFSKNCD